MSHLKLITLNIEGDCHLDLIKLFLIKESADVICLQEIFEEDFFLLQQYLKMEGKFAPMVKITKPNKIRLSPKGIFGIAIFSRNPIVSSSCNFYLQHQKTTPIFEDGKPNSVDRVLLTIKTTKDNLDYQIATTHFIWSEKGEITQLQQQGLQDLFKITDQVGDCVLCGDFNTPYGQEIHQQITEKFDDNTPAGITTTIDQQLHRNKNIQLIVDYIFTSKNYIAKNIRTVENVSDHKAIVANIKR